MTPTIEWTGEAVRLLDQTQLPSRTVFVEITDHDMRGEIPVLLAAGDLLVFHGHLMHKSTDNRSRGMRAAMVYHYGEAGTVDRTLEFRPTTLNDWLPVLRDGRPVA